VRPATRILPHKAVYPTLASQCFVAPTASVIGNVELGKGVSVWYGAVVRGDVHHVKVSVPCFTMLL
jgi:gamma-carbonic anhydrase